MKLRPHLVERRHADVAATGDVDRREVERLAEQGLLHGRCDELVDLVGELLRHAAQNVFGAGCGVGVGVEEGRRQRPLGHDAIGINGVDCFTQLRVPETERRLRIFEGNVGLMSLS